MKGLRLSVETMEKVCTDLETWYVCGEVLQWTFSGPLVAWMKHIRLETMYHNTSGSSG